jgi:hypothetical protein
MPHVFRINIHIDCQFDYLPKLLIDILTTKGAHYRLGKKNPINMDMLKLTYPN